jgi:hypothetical protein
MLFVSITVKGKVVPFALTAGMPIRSCAQAGFAVCEVRVTNAKPSFQFSRQAPRFMQNRGRIRGARWRGSRQFVNTSRLIVTDWPSSWLQAFGEDLDWLREVRRNRVPPSSSYLFVIVRYARFCLRASRRASEAQR